MSRNQLVPVANTLYKEGADVDQPLKVGIIGAGCAGLFTAMILDHLKDKYKLNVEYEILESNKEERLGGRLYTHYFTEKESHTPNHNYYDVGAMRFPEIKIMDR